MFLSRSESPHSELFKDWRQAGGTARKSPHEEGAGTHTSSGRIHQNRGPALVGISPWPDSHSYAVMSC